MGFDNQDNAQQLAEIRQYNMQSVGKLLQQKQKRIESLLPVNVSVERLQATVMEAMRANPQLAECFPDTIIGAALKAAQLGLDPGVGEVWFVPMWNKFRGGRECNLWPGYKGYIKHARRSGMVSVFEAMKVYEVDEFEFAYGDSSQRYLYHVPNIQAEDRGRLVATYAYCKLTDGSEQFRVAGIAEIMAAKNRSRSGDKKDSAWNIAFEEMAMVVPVRALAKWVPQSVEGQLAVSLGEMADAGVQQDMSKVIEGEAQRVQESQPQQGSADGEQSEQPDQPERQGPVTAKGNSVVEKLRSQR